MAIRIREINGTTVALCAAKTQAKKNDIYLNDCAYHALPTKFAVDWVSEGRVKIEDECSDDIVKKLMLEGEEDNG